MRKPSVSGIMRRSHSEGTITNSATLASTNGAFLNDRRITDPVTVELRDEYGPVMRPSHSASRWASRTTAGHSTEFLIRPACSERSSSPLS